MEDCPRVSPCLVYVEGHRTWHSVSLGEPPGDSLGTSRPQPDLIAGHTVKSSGLCPSLPSLALDKLCWDLLDKQL